MEFNKIDNETAEHVIDLIDTLINTPVFSSTASKKNMSKPNLNYDTNQSVKIIEHQKRNNVELIRTKFNKNHFPQFISESDDEPILDLDKYTIDVDSDKILPIGFNKQNTFDDKKIIYETENIIKQNSPKKIIHNSKQQSNIESSNIDQSDYELIESYGNQVNPARDALNPLTNHEKQQKISPKIKNKRAKINKYKHQIKQKIKEVIPTVEPTKKIKKLNIKPLDMNADTDYLVDQHIIINENIIEKISSENIIKELPTPIDAIYLPENPNTVSIADTISDDKYDILIGMINYLVIIIDFLNKLIYQILDLAHEKIISNENNFELIRFYYNMLFDNKTNDEPLAIGKVERQ